MIAAIDRSRSRHSIPRTERIGAHYIRVLFLSVLCALSCAGCGPRRAKAVNVELAKATLVKVLDHWKSGGLIEDLQSESPQIVAQEILWSNGNQLQSYTLLGEGRPEDANWYCDVELTLIPKDGGDTSKKKVTYVVGTDPVITVFHAIL